MCHFLLFCSSALIIFTPILTSDVKVKNNENVYRIDNNIDEDMLECIPNDVLGIRYGDSVDYKDLIPGATVPLNYTVYHPDVSYDFCDGSQDSYAVLMVDFDALGTAPSKSYIHWLYTHSCQCNSRTTVLEYVTPAPPPGSCHRYLFIYFQKLVYNFSCDSRSDVIRPNSINRQNFSLHAFADKYRYGRPLASNLMLTSSATTSTY